jgi:hypothetical protein
MEAAKKYLFFGHRFNFGGFFGRIKEYGDN